MHFRFNLPTHRQLLANWQRGLTLILCVVMLPIPIPMMHRHDEIESRDELACHLVTRHHLLSRAPELVEFATDDCHCPMLDEPHWHFVLPSQYPGDDDTGDQVPPAEHAFLAFANNTVAVASVSRDQEFDLSCPIAVSGGLIETLDDRSDQHRHCRRAADALQVSRCALACVMRC